MPRRPAALTIAGSDNSCGAGAQADLQAFAALGCYGQTALTCVVAENPKRVAGIVPLAPSFVVEQVRLSRELFPPKAAKTGMLHSAKTVDAVAAELSDARFPVVVDPVMVASTGDPLLEPRAVASYKSALFPLASLLTPNTDELALLVGGQVKTLADLRAAAHALEAESGCPVLAKGGHLGGTLARDVLVRRGRETFFDAPRIRGASAHGTGCTYSAAITAFLATGVPLVESINRAKKFLTAALSSGLRVGRTRVLDLAPVAHTP